MEETRPQTPNSRNRKARTRPHTHSLPALPFTEPREVRHFLELFARRRLPPPRGGGRGGGRSGKNRGEGSRGFRIGIVHVPDTLNRPLPRQRLLKSEELIELDCGHVGISATSEPRRDGLIPTPLLPQPSPLVSCESASGHPQLFQVPDQRVGNPIVGDRERGQCNGSDRSPRWGGHDRGNLERSLLGRGGGPHVGVR